MSPRQSIVVVGIEGNDVLSQYQLKKVRRRRDGLNHVFDLAIASATPSVRDAASIISGLKGVVILPTLEIDETVGGPTERIRNELDRMRKKLGLNPLEAYLRQGDVARISLRHFAYKAWIDILETVKTRPAGQIVVATHPVWAAAIVWESQQLSMDFICQRSWAGCEGAEITLQNHKISSIQSLPRLS